MTIGENIKEIRKKKGLTQKQLGDKCRINEANIRKYENGKQNPKIQTIKRIADALGVSLGELIGNDYESVSSDPYFLSSLKPERAVEILENMYDTWEKAGFSANNPPKDETDKQKIYHVARKKELLIAFESLNYHGKVIAVQRVEELTEIPKYTEPDTPPQS